MFLLTVPKGETQGSCRINGREAEYKLLDNPKHGRYIVWRYADPNESRHWDRRNVLSSEDIKDGNDVECTSFMCDDGQAPGEQRPPYVVIKAAELEAELDKAARLGDVLPYQEWFFMLIDDDGNEARHTIDRTAGIVIFTDRQKAEEMKGQWPGCRVQAAKAEGVYEALEDDALCVFKETCVVMIQQTIDSEETVKLAAGEGVADA
jgi:hypothetical protein